MTDTTKLLQLAQLAEASYAKLDQIGQQNSDDKILDVKSIQELEKLSPTQATEFAENWQVVHHQPNTTSGYSGTLFKYIGNDTMLGSMGNNLLVARYSVTIDAVASNDNECRVAA